MFIVQKIRNSYYIFLFYSLTLLILKFLIQEKIKEMEQEHVPKGDISLLAKEIVNLVVGNNFRGFWFKSTQHCPSTTSTTSRASLVETEQTRYFIVKRKS